MSFSASFKASGCFNKQRTGFCSRKRIVHQVMCPGVKPWSCNMAELRCGCVKGTARRADGKCVAPNECSATRTVRPKPTKEPEDTIEDSVFFSGGDYDCPDDNKCREACRERGFQNGYCDRLLLKPCYCYTRVSKPPTKRPTIGKDPISLSWPYGHIAATGELIKELTDTHGCPSDTSQCFKQCNRLGVKGAFCGYQPPYHCFCESYIPKYLRELIKDYDYSPQSSGHTSCTDPGFCDMYCTSLGHRGGFCPPDDPKECYCYDMRDYDPKFNLPFAEKPPKYRSKDLSAPTLKVLQSRIKIVLVLISEAAWVMSRCQYMQSTFEEALSDYAVRTVGCHMPLDVEAGALSTTNQTAKINFTVKHKKAATRIQLQSESEELPFSLQKSYLVLAATSTCVVVQISDLVRGEPLCALWGLESANWNDEQYCFVTMEQICMQPVFNAFAERDRCAEKSAHAKDTLKRR
ncbi:uncharacterized protein LOC144134294 [Amblyomma americanum]